VPTTDRDQTGDALRRTRLAGERTFLAWWRTGLATFAVGLGAGKLIPELSHGTQWPFEVIGTAFCLSGIALIAYGYLRQKEVEAALARGDYAAFDSRAGFVFALLGVVLGLSAILVILLESG
jgi:putative membrane protein